MQNKLIFGLIWLGFISYAVFFAPPSDPDTLDLIASLASGNIQNINPLIVALFNLMGILPIIYTSLLLFDGRNQKIPAWLFAAGSFGLGAFTILPYLALRKPNKTWQGEKNLLLKILESPVTAILITITTLILLFWGVTRGDWQSFIQQWHDSKFIHVMSLDFCLLSLLPPVLIKDDLARRNIDNSLVWFVSLIPLLGILTYLCLRNFLERESVTELDFISSN